MNAPVSINVTPVLVADLHLEGELDLLPGIRLVPAPGHTPGTQVVVVEGGSRPVVLGDMGVWFGELVEPETEGQLLVRALEPAMVWLAHTDEPSRQPVSAFAER